MEQKEKYTKRKKKNGGNYCHSNSDSNWDYFNDLIF